MFCWRRVLFSLYIYFGKNIMWFLKDLPMREIIIKIPDTKFDFFMELLQQLGIQFDQAQEDDMSIPELHKMLVRERIKKSNENPKRILDWDEVKGYFRFN
jgi:hypothetical protein